MQSQLDRERRGGSLAEKVTNLYAHNSDLHTRFCTEMDVYRTHTGGYGQGGERKWSKN